MASATTGLGVSHPDVDTITGSSSAAARSTVGQRLSFALTKAGYQTGRSGAEGGGDGGGGGDGVGSVPLPPLLDKVLSPYDMELIEDGLNTARTLFTSSTAAAGGGGSGVVSTSGARGGSKKRKQCLRCGSEAHLVAACTAPKGKASAPSTPTTAGDGGDGAAVTATSSADKKSWQVVGMAFTRVTGITGALHSTTPPDVARALLDVLGSDLMGLANGFTSVVKSSHGLLSNLGCRRLFDAAALAPETLAEAVSASRTSKEMTKKRADIVLHFSAVLHDEEQSAFEVQNALRALGAITLFLSKCSALAAKATPLLRASTTTSRGSVSSSHTSSSVATQAPSAVGTCPPSSGGSFFAGAPLSRAPPRPPSYQALHQPPAYEQTATPVVTADAVKEFMGRALGAQIGELTNCCRRWVVDGSGAPAATAGIGMGLSAAAIGQARQVVLKDVTSATAIIRQMLSHRLLPLLFLAASSTGATSSPQQQQLDLEVRRRSAAFVSQLVQVLLSLSALVFRPDESAVPAPSGVGSSGTSTTAAEALDEETGGQGNKRRSKKKQGVAPEQALRTESKVASPPPSASTKEVSIQQVISGSGKARRSLLLLFARDVTAIFSEVLRFALSQPVDAAFSIFSTSAPLIFSSTATHSLESDDEVALPSLSMSSVLTEVLWKICRQSDYLNFEANETKGSPELRRIVRHLWAESLTLAVLCADSLRKVKGWTMVDQDSGLTTSILAPSVSSTIPKLMLLQFFDVLCSTPALVLTRYTPSVVAELAKIAVDGVASDSTLLSGWFLQKKAFFLSLFTLDHDLFMTTVAEVLATLFLTTSPSPSKSKQHRGGGAGRNAPSGDPITTRRLIALSLLGPQYGVHSSFEAPFLRSYLLALLEVLTTTSASPLAPTATSHPSKTSAEKGTLGGILQQREGEEGIMSFLATASSGGLCDGGFELLMMALSGFTHKTIDLSFVSSSAAAAPRSHSGSTTATSSSVISSATPEERARFFFYAKTLLDLAISRHRETCSPSSSSFARGTTSAVVIHCLKLFVAIAEPLANDDPNNLSMCSVAFSNASERQRWWWSTAAYLTNLHYRCGGGVDVLSDGGGGATTTGGSALRRRLFEPLSNMILFVTIGLVGTPPREEGGDTTISNASHENVDMAVVKQPMLKLHVDTSPPREEAAAGLSTKNTANEEMSQVCINVLRFASAFQTRYGAAVDETIPSYFGTVFAVEQRIRHFLSALTVHTTNGSKVTAANTSSSFPDSVFHMLLRKKSDLLQLSVALERRIPRPLSNGDDVVVGVVDAAGQLVNRDHIRILFSFLSASPMASTTAAGGGECLGDAEWVALVMHYASVMAEERREPVAALGSIGAAAVAESHLITSIVAALTFSLNSNICLPSGSSSPAPVFHTVQNFLSAMTSVTKSWAEHCLLSDVWSSSMAATFCSTSASSRPSGSGFKTTSHLRPGQAGACFAARNKCRVMLLLLHELERQYLLRTDLGSTAGVVPIVSGAATQRAEASKAFKMFFAANRMHFLHIAHTVLIHTATSMPWTSMPSQISRLAAGTVLKSSFGRLQDIRNFSDRVSPATPDIAKVKAWTELEKIIIAAACALSHVEDDVGLVCRTLEGFLSIAQRVFQMLFVAKQTPTSSAGDGTSSPTAKSSTAAKQTQQPQTIQAPQFPATLLRSIGYTVPFLIKCLQLLLVGQHEVCRANLLQQFWGSSGGCEWTSWLQLAAVEFAVALTCHVAVKLTDKSLLVAMHNALQMTAVAAEDEDDTTSTGSSRTGAGLFTPFVASRNTYLRNNLLSVLFDECFKSEGAELIDDETHSGGGSHPDGHPPAKVLHPLAFSLREASVSIGGASSSSAVAAAEKSSLREAERAAVLVLSQWDERLKKTNRGGGATFPQSSVAPPPAPPALLVLFPSMPFTRTAIGDHDTTANKGKGLRGAIEALGSNNSARSRTMQLGLASYLQRTVLSASVKGLHPSEQVLQQLLAAKARDDALLDAASSAPLPSRAGPPAEDRDGRLAVIASMRIATGFGNRFLSSGSLVSSSSSSLSQLASSSTPLGCGDDIADGFQSMAKAASLLPLQVTMRSPTTATALDDGASLLTLARELRRRGNDLAATAITTNRISATSSSSSSGSGFFASPQAELAFQLLSVAADIATPASRSSSSTSTTDVESDSTASDLEDRSLALRTQFEASSKLARWATSTSQGIITGAGMNADFAADVLSFGLQTLFRQIETSVATGADSPLTQSSVLSLLKIVNTALPTVSSSPDKRELLFSRVGAFFHKHGKMLRSALEPLLPELCTQLLRCKECTATTQRTTSSAVVGGGIQSVLTALLSTAVSGEEVSPHLLYALADNTIEGPEQQQHLVHDLGASTAVCERVHQVATFMQQLRGLSGFPSEVAAKECYRSLKLLASALDVYPSAAGGGGRQLQQPVASSTTAGGKPSTRSSRGGRRRRGGRKGRRAEEEAEIYARVEQSAGSAEEGRRQAQRLWASDHHPSVLKKVFDRLETVAGEIRGGATTSSTSLTSVLWKKFHDRLGGEVNHAVLELQAELTRCATPDGRNVSPEDVLVKLKQCYKLVESLESSVSKFEREVGQRYLTFVEPGVHKLAFTRGGFIGSLDEVVPSLRLTTFSSSSGSTAPATSNDGRRTKSLFLGFPFRHLRSTSPEHSSAEATSLHAIHDTFLILNTKSRPRLLSVTLGDGTSKGLLVKGQDDLRVDRRVLAVFDFANNVLRSQQQSSRRKTDSSTNGGLCVDHALYSVIPFGSSGGLIEIVPGMDSVFSLYVRHYLQHGLAEKSTYRSTHDDLSQLHDARSRGGLLVSEEGKDNLKSSAASKHKPHDPKEQHQYDDGEDDDDDDESLDDNNEDAEADEDDIGANHAATRILLDEAVATIKKVSTNEMYLSRLRKVANDVTIHRQPRKSWSKEAMRQTLMELMRESPQDLLAQEFITQTSLQCRVMAAASSSNEKEMKCPSLVHGGSHVSLNTAEPIAFPSAVPPLALPIDNLPRVGVAMVDTHGWWLRTRNFTSSLASETAMGYLVGVGDRHLDNIMVDSESGKAAHIDFTVAFDKGKALRVPETVPFRMTPVLMSAMGPQGAEGGFTHSFAQVVSTLQSHRHDIMNLVSSFFYSQSASSSSSPTPPQHSSQSQSSKSQELTPNVLNYCKDSVGKLLTVIDSNLLPQLESLYSALGEFQVSAHVDEMCNTIRNKNAATQHLQWDTAVADDAAHMIIQQQQETKTLQSKFQDMQDEAVEASAALSKLKEEIATGCFEETALLDELLDQGSALRRELRFETFAPSAQHQKQNVALFDLNANISHLLLRELIPQLQDCLLRTDTSSTSLPTTTFGGGNVSTSASSQQYLSSSLRHRLHTLLSLLEEDPTDRLVLEHCRQLTQQWTAAAFHTTDDDADAPEVEMALHLQQREYQELHQRVGTFTRTMDSLAGCLPTSGGGAQDDDDVLRSKMSVLAGSVASHDLLPRLAESSEDVCQALSAAFGVKVREQLSKVLSSLNVTDNVSAVTPSDAGVILPPPFLFTQQSPSLRACLSVAELLRYVASTPPATTIRLVDAALSVQVLEVCSAVSHLWDFVCTHLLHDDPAAAAGTFSPSSSTVDVAVMKDHLVTVISHAFDATASLLSPPSTISKAGMTASMNNVFESGIFSPSPSSTSAATSAFSLLPLYRLEDVGEQLFHQVLSKLLEDLLLPALLGCCHQAHLFPSTTTVGVLTTTTTTSTEGNNNHHHHQVHEAEGWKEADTKAMASVSVVLHHALEAAWIEASSSSSSPSSVAVSPLSDWYQVATMQVDLLLTSFSDVVSELVRRSSAAPLATEVDLRLNYVSDVVALSQRELRAMEWAHPSTSMRHLNSSASANLKREQQRAAAAEEKVLLQQWLPADVLVGLDDDDEESTTNQMDVKAPQEDSGDEGSVSSSSSTSSSQRRERLLMRLFNYANELRLILSSTPHLSSDERRHAELMHQFCLDLVFAEWRRVPFTLVVPEGVVSNTNTELSAAKRPLVHDSDLCTADDDDDDDDQLPEEELDQEEGGVGRRPSATGAVSTPSSVLPDWFPVSDTTLLQRCRSLLTHHQALVHEAIPQVVSEVDRHTTEIGIAEAVQADAKSRVQQHRERQIAARDALLKLSTGPSMAEARRVCQVVSGKWAAAMTTLRQTRPLVMKTLAGEPTAVVPSTQLPLRHGTPQPVVVVLPRPLASELSRLDIVLRKMADCFAIIQEIPSNLASGGGGGGTSAGTPSTSSSAQQNECLWFDFQSQLPWTAAALAEFTSTAKTLHGVATEVGVTGLPASLPSLGVAPRDHSSPTAALPKYFAAQKGSDAAGGGRRLAWGEAATATGKEGSPTGKTSSNESRQHPPFSSSSGGVGDPIGWTPTGETRRLLFALHQRLTPSGADSASSPSMTSSAASSVAASSGSTASLLGESSTISHLPAPPPPVEGRGGSSTTRPSSSQHQQQQEPLPPAKLPGQLQAVDQAARLLQQAVSIDRLAAMYEGWGAWL